MKEVGYKNDVDHEGGEYLRNKDRACEKLRRAQAEKLDRDLYDIQGSMGSR